MHHSRAERHDMLVSALLLVTLALLLCAVAIHKLFAVLHLDPMQTLVWLGLAEAPAPPTSRRRFNPH